MEEALNNLYDDLEREAYCLDTHTYLFKEANQVIRRHFEKNFTKPKPRGKKLLLGLKFPFKVR